jgi:hypothetical protein
MKVLHLTLKKKWFDMIASGVKKEEYRECKEYWHKRLVNCIDDAVLFRNGYSKNSPSVLVELLYITMGFGNTEHGAPKDTVVYILKLGKVLSVKRSPSK